MIYIIYQIKNYLLIAIKSNHEEKLRTKYYAKSAKFISGSFTNTCYINLYHLIISYYFI